MTAEEMVKAIDHFIEEVLKPPKPPMSNDEIIDMVKNPVPCDTRNKDRKFTRCEKCGLFYKLSIGHRCGAD